MNPPKYTTYPDIDHPEEYHCTIHGLMGALSRAATVSMGTPGVQRVIRHSGGMSWVIRRFSGGKEM